MRDFFQSSGPSGAGNSAGNAQPSYTLGVIRLVPCGGHGLAGTDLAKKPGDSSRREVMNGAVAGGGKFEPGRDHVADGHVAGRGLPRIGYLEGIHSFTVEITQFGAARLQFQPWYHRCHDGAVLSRDIAIGLGDDLTLLLAHNSRATAYLDVACFTGGEVADLEIKRLTTLIFTPGP
jgi:hypothetical protein